MLGVLVSLILVGFRDDCAGSVTLVLLGAILDDICAGT